mgnify:CR=1 FL=1
MGNEARSKGVSRRRFGAIYFAHRSVALGQRARRLIGAHAKYLERHPGMLVAVVGHRDAAETAAQPARLGKARAAAVRDCLESLGVHESRMTTASFGDRMPRYAGSGAALRAANRRVDIIYFGASVAGGSPPAARKRAGRIRR